MERIKPPTCLVLGFGDEVGRELGLVFRRALRVGHTAALEPAVQYFGDTLELTPTLTVPAHLIYEVFV